MAKVVLGLSGGVDSAVAARLLQREGHEVLGLYLDNTDAAARADAVRTAEYLGVPLEIVDVHEMLNMLVETPFAESYLRGETPSPCILCNPAVKFRCLAECAERIGAEFIATGHYARAKDGMLFKGMPANDQSYMLCRITRDQLAHLLLPLGGLEKAQTRALAEEFGIPIAHKPDSMEICFIPDKDYIGWLARRCDVPGAGDAVFHGEIVGRHEGIYRWTVGQRWPGLHNERKLYVAGIDAERNEIELVLWEELFKTEVRARDVNWLIDPPDEPIRAGIRVRHTKWENPDCTVVRDGKNILVTCDEPVRAPAKGQAAAIYQGDRVIAGGWIC